MLELGKRRRGPTRGSAISPRVFHRPAVHVREEAARIARGALEEGWIEKVAHTGDRERLKAMVVGALREATSSSSRGRAVCASRGSRPKSKGNGPEKDAVPSTLPAACGLLFSTSSLHHVPHDLRGDHGAPSVLRDRPMAHPGAGLPPDRADDPAGRARTAPGEGRYPHDGRAAHRPGHRDPDSPVGQPGQHLYLDRRLRDRGVRDDRVHRRLQEGRSKGFEGASAPHEVPQPDPTGGRRRRSSTWTSGSRTR